MQRCTCKKRRRRYRCRKKISAPSVRAGVGCPASPLPRQNTFITREHVTRTAVCVANRGVRFAGDDEGSVRRSQLAARSCVRGVHNRRVHARAQQRSEYLFSPYARVYIRPTDRLLILHPPRPPPLHMRSALLFGRHRPGWHFIEKNLRRRRRPNSDTTQPCETEADYDFYALPAENIF